MDPDLFKEHYEPPVQGNKKHYDKLVLALGFLHKRNYEKAEQIIEDVRQRIQHGDSIIDQEKED